MGYIKHHAIIVTSYDKKYIKKAYLKAQKICGAKRVSKIVESPINIWFTFLVGPDGSKEGWLHSNIGDEQRTEFINYINSQAYEDKSNSLSYAELFYGEDDGHARITKHN